MNISANQPNSTKNITQKHIHWCIFMHVCMHTGKYRYTHTQRYIYMHVYMHKGKYVTHMCIYACMCVMGNSINDNEEMNIIKREHIFK